MLEIKIPPEIINQWHRVTGITGNEAVKYLREGKPVFVKISDILAKLKKQESILRPPRPGAGF
jgi:hypothetical protein